MFINPQVVYKNMHLITINFKIWEKFIIFKFVPRGANVTGGKRLILPKNKVSRLSRLGDC